MAELTELKHDWARVALAVVRLFNGGMALVAPQWLVRRLGADPDKQPATLYVFRMFGIRTVLIGFDLLTEKPEQRAKSLRAAVLIHASDTLAALLAGVSGRLPKRGAATVTVISAANTALAALALSKEKQG